MLPHVEKGHDRRAAGPRTARKLVVSQLLFWALALAHGGAAGGYLKTVGPTTVRFQPEPRLATVAVLPPLHMEPEILAKTGDAGSTNKAVATAAQTNVPPPAEVLEAYGPPAPSTLTAEPMPLSTNAMAGASSAPSAAVPLMRFFEPGPARSNAPPVFLLPTPFVPPDIGIERASDRLHSPVSSSAVYKSN